MDLGPPPSLIHDTEHNNGVREGDGEVDNSPRHGALDGSEDELFVVEGPLQSTPKRPELTAPSTLPLPSGKKSSVSKKGASGKD